MGSSGASSARRLDHDLAARHVPRHDRDGHSHHLRARPERAGVLRVHRPDGVPARDAPTHVRGHRLVRPARDSPLRAGGPRDGRGRPHPAPVGPGEPRGGPVPRRHVAHRHLGQRALRRRQRLGRGRRRGTRVRAHSRHAAPGLRRELRRGARRRQFDHRAAHSAQHRHDHLRRAQRHLDCAAARRRRDAGAAAGRGPHGVRALDRGRAQLSTQRAPWWT